MSCAEIGPNATGRSVVGPSPVTALRMLREHDETAPQSQHRPRADRLQSPNPLTCDCINPRPLSGVFRPPPHCYRHPEGGGDPGPHRRRHRRAGPRPPGRRLRRRRGAARPARRAASGPAVLRALRLPQGLNPLLAVQQPGGLACLGRAAGGNRQREAGATVSSGASYTTRMSYSPNGYPPARVLASHGLERRPDRFDAVLRVLDLGRNRLRGVRNLVHIQRHRTIPYPGVRSGSSGNYRALRRLCVSGRR